MYNFSLNRHHKKLLFLCTALIFFNSFPVKCTFTWFDAANVVIGICIGATGAFAISEALIKKQIADKKHANEMHRILLEQEYILLLKKENQSIIEEIRQKSPEDGEVYFTLLTACLKKNEIENSVLTEEIVHECVQLKDMLFEIKNHHIVRIEFKNK